MAVTKRKSNKIKDFAAELTVSGSVSKAADKIGVSRATGYRMKEREEVQKELEIQSQRMLALIPKAVDNMTTLVENMDTIVEKDVFDKDGRKTGVKTELKYDPKITYAATKDVLTAPGLLSGGQVSVQIGKMTVTNNTQIISPNVLELLKQSVGVPKMLEDVTVEDVDGEDDVTKSNKTIDNSTTEVLQS